MSTSTHVFPAQRRDAGTTGADFHDHAWREIEDPEEPLAIGMYRCDLCHVVWAL